MKFKKPNQHGVWAMLFMPFLFGIFAGKFSLLQLCFIAGWFLVFFATDNFLFYMKKRKKQQGYLLSAALFDALALVCMLPVLILVPKVSALFLAMIPFAFINIYFAKERNERHILNDLAAVIIFSIAGVISYYIGVRQLDGHALFIFIMSMIYFCGTILYVKTMIREKKNQRYRLLSYSYHVIAVVLLFFISPLLSLAMLPSLARAILFYGRNMKPIQIGLIEIANACFVTLVVAIYYL